MGGSNRSADDGVSERAPEKVFVFRSFLEEESGAQLVEEALDCHQRNCQDSDADFSSISCSVSSLKLELGISCGGDLSAVLPLAGSIARRAFIRAAAVAENDALRIMADSSPPLAGLSLMYGLKASMPPHYDSPTQPGQGEEWLAMITLGNTVLFRCNDEILELHSGDVIVMDSMAVLHGVEGIVEDGLEMSTKLGLPTPGARLGILFWQGRTTRRSPPPEVVEGFSQLFEEEN